eukprot:1160445-Pelagomonas_calceolata.AAC.4
MWPLFLNDAENVLSFRPAMYFKSLLCSFQPILSMQELCLDPSEQLCIHKLQPNAALAWLPYLYHSCQAHALMLMCLGTKFQLAVSPFKWTRCALDPTWEPKYGAELGENVHLGIHCTNNGRNASEFVPGPPPGP